MRFLSGLKPWGSSQDQAELRQDYDGTPIVLQLPEDRRRCWGKPGHSEGRTPAERRCPPLCATE
jgi:hypothetical protein